MLAATFQNATDRRMYACRSAPGICRSPNYNLRQEVQGSGMPSLMASERTSETGVEDGMSWRRLAEAVRRQARMQPDAAADLLEFANLLNAFAELEDLA